MPLCFSRRTFLQHSAHCGLALTGIAGILHARQAPAAIASDQLRPTADWGLQIGEVLEDRAVIWSRSSAPARLSVEWSRDEHFAQSAKIQGPLALADSDFTARVDLSGLPRGADIFVRVVFADLDAGRALSQPVLGRFRTPAEHSKDIRFVWAGDTVGQGWGIDLRSGGMQIYESMRRVHPDFFIHSGDTIYADGPLQETVADARGDVIWRNAHLDAVPEKRGIAQTLHEFRRHHLYNRYDEHNRRFSAEVPQIWQWDDHEVTNNWSTAKVLGRRYDERDLGTLTARAKRAFLEYAPLRRHTSVEAERIYRHIPYGGDLDVFVIDLRSYRGPNSDNRQALPGAASALLGQQQLIWLKQQLRQSTAVWKVIATDMPIGLLVPDGIDGSGRPQFDAVANGDGAVLGREWEVAALLRFIKHEGIVNVVWLTADVHYCAAHYYDPNAAQFQDFDPFWEFVAGPLHAGSFGPNPLDNTFGPRCVFQRAAPQPNMPPSAGFQSFGQIDIDCHSKVLTVALKATDGVTVFSQQLNALPLRARS